MKIAVTNRRLKGFVSPDTLSQFEGYVDPGRYEVLELKESFPNADTDYVRISAPFLSANDTWLCIRWKQQTYGTISNLHFPLQHSVIEDDDFLPESVLVDELQTFIDFTYDLDNARYPVPLKNVQIPLAPPYTNNCCTFVEALIVQAWQKNRPGFSWNAEHHRQMMIMSDEDFFSPITALVEADIGIFVPDPETKPSPWTVIQGWRNKWRGGHTFIIVDYDPETDNVLTLESNSAYKLNGVGFRCIGNLRDIGVRPPSNWANTPGLWTWNKIMSTYRYREQAILKVKDYQWSKG